MKYLINFYIKKIKKEQYEIDSNIPSSYLVLLAIRRFYMLLKGSLSFINKKGILFIGHHVEIKSRSKISIGYGVTIDDYCYIDALSKEGIVLGNNVSVGKRTVIECTGNLKFLGKGLTVQDNVGLGTDSFYGCAGGIRIGSDTIIGNYVSLHSENHNYLDSNIPIRLQGVNHRGIVIGNNCWIGAKATILDGATLMDGCIITAGAVVTAGVYEADGIYGGVPARLLKKRF